MEFVSLEFTEVGAATKKKKLKPLRAISATSIRGALLAPRIDPCGTDQSPARRVKAPLDVRIRVQRDRSGPRKTNQGPERRIGTRGTSQGESGPAVLTKDPQDESVPRGMDQGPAE